MEKLNNKTKKLNMELVERMQFYKEELYDSSTDFLFELLEIKEEDSLHIQDFVSEFADDHVSIYNLDLLEWLKDDMSRTYYCDLAISDLGFSDFWDVLKGAQFLEYTEAINEDLLSILRAYAFKKLLSKVDYLIDDLKVEYLIKAVEDFDFLECEYLSEIDEFISDLVFDVENKEGYKLKQDQDGQLYFAFGSDNWEV